MSFTGQQVANDARALMRDPGAVNWTDATMITVIQEGIDIIRRLLERENPDFWSKPMTVNLTVAGANGPYTVPADFSYLVALQDIYLNDLVPVRRESVAPSIASGPPRGYWMEGFEENTVIYFDMNPDQAYAYKGRYMPKATTIAAITDNVPLPDFCRTVLKVWTTKVAFQMDEYATMDEDQKMSIVMPQMKNMGLVDTNPIVAAFDEGYF